MDKFFYVYIIYSESQDIYYKGISSYPYFRLQQHNDNRSRFTANKGPWSLVYLKKFDTKRNALIEEGRLKKLNRSSLEKFIYG